MLGYAARSSVRANFDRETKKQSPSIMFKPLGGCDDDGDSSINGERGKRGCCIVPGAARADLGGVVPSTSSSWFGADVGVGMGIGVGVGVGMDMDVGLVGTTADLAFLTSNSDGFVDGFEDRDWVQAAHQNSGAKSLSLLEQFQADVTTMVDPCTAKNMDTSDSRSAALLQTQPPAPKHGAKPKTLQRSKYHRRDAPSHRPRGGKQGKNVGSGSRSGGKLQGSENAEFTKPKGLKKAQSFNAKRIACIQCGRKDVTFGKNQRKKYGNRARCRMCTQADKKASGDSKSLAGSGSAQEIENQSKVQTKHGDRKPQGRSRKRSSTRNEATTGEANGDATSGHNKSLEFQSASSQCHKKSSLSVAITGAPAAAKPRTLSITHSTNEAQKCSQDASTASNKYSNTGPNAQTAEATSRLAFFRTLTRKDEPPSSPMGSVVPRKAVSEEDVAETNATQGYQSSGPSGETFDFGDYGGESDDGAWVHAVTDKEWEEQRRREAEQSSVSMSGSVSIRFVASPHIGSRSVGSALVAHEASTYLVKACLDRGDPQQAILEKRRSIEALREVLGKVVDSTGALQRAIEEATCDLVQLEREFPNAVGTYGSEQTESFWGRAVDVSRFEDGPDDTSPKLDSRSSMFRPPSFSNLLADEVVAPTDHEDKPYSCSVAGQ